MGEEVQRAPQNVGHVSEFLRLHGFDEGTHTCTMPAVFLYRGTQTTVAKHYIAAITKI